jgi:hypothetical protein
MTTRNRVSLLGTMFSMVLAASHFGCGGSSTTPPPPAILVLVSPEAGTVQAGAAKNFVANASNSSGIAWSVSCSATPCGSISPTSTASGAPATYTAPSTAPTNDLKVTLSAAATTDPTQIGTAIVTVPAILVTLSSTTASVQINTQQQFSAAVSYDPSNEGVTWALTQNGSPCSPNCGTISPPSAPSGAPITYTAPAVVPAIAAVMLTATSMTDTTKSAQAVLTVVPPPPIAVNIGPTTAVIQVNGTVHFGAGVAYDPNNAGVTWTLGGCSGGTTVCGAITNINNAGPYTADYLSPAAVPPGAKITVTATSITDNTKSATASVTINATTFTSQNYPAGSSPTAVAVADFNGDGKLDVAVADYGNPSTGDNGGVSILLGNGDGTFQPAISVAAGKNPLAIAVGDFNNDGKIDLALTLFGDRSSGGSGSVEILLGNGDGTFQPPTMLNAGDEPFPITVGDFNGDGKLDFAVTDFDSGVYLFLGEGDGSFRTPTQISAGLNPCAIVAADFNVDGKLDLAVADTHDPSNTDNGGVSVLLGNGDGTFQPAMFYTLPVYSTSLTAGDLNGDGKLDLVVSAFSSTFGLEGSVLNVLLGNGNGTFGQDIETGTGKTESGSVFPLSVVIAKFDPNAKPDVVEVSGYSLQILLGNGDGTFEGSLFFNADQQPFQLRVADFNADGKPDIVVANQGSNDITILLNATGP